MRTEQYEDLPESLEGNDPEFRQQVLQELERILASRFFRTSERAKQFLQFIVLKKLEGSSTELKERLIGVELYKRPNDYSTGEDPVVRVQAGLVRKRLEQHYQVNGGDSSLRIQLPSGSYAPVFQRLSEESAAAVSSPPICASSSLPQPEHSSGNSKRLWIVPAIGLLLLVGALVVLIRYGVHRQTAFEKFWAPVLSSPQPALVCLGNGVTYRPTLELYRRYEKTHPGAFLTETERTNRALPLDPQEKISWRDIYPIDEWGIARGDLSAAVRLAAFFGRMGKVVDLRVTPESNYRDLRDFPAILVGAYNNEWTMSLMTDLRYSFADDGGKFRIQDKQDAKKFWLIEPGLRRDYAVAARLLNAKSGQFTVIVAGLTSRGTEAAGEFVSSQKALELGLQNAPEDWQKKNLELVLETDVTQGVSGPPHVVAMNSW